MGDINKREIKEGLKIPALRKPDEDEIKLLGRRKLAQRTWFPMFQHDQGQILGYNWGDMYEHMGTRE